MTCIIRMNGISDDAKVANVTTTIAFYKPVFTAFKLGAYIRNQEPIAASYPAHTVIYELGVFCGQHRVGKRVVQGCNDKFALWSLYHVNNLEQVLIIPVRHLHQMRVIAVE